MGNKFDDVSLTPNPSPIERGARRILYLKAIAPLRFQGRFFVYRREGRMMRFYAEICNCCRLGYGAGLRPVPNRG